MPQGDQNVANASGATVRADINSELQALVSLSSGPSAPGTTYPNQLWVDTTNAVLKRRDNGNSAWMIRDTMDTDRVLSKSSAYTVQLRDVRKLILGDTTSAGFTLTLPAVASAGEGFRFECKNIGTGAFGLTLDPNSSETINGSTTIVLADGESASVWCDGTAWQAIVMPVPDSLSLPRGYLSGLGLSNAGTDADHDIVIAAGECRDAADALDLVLPSALTKQIDAPWAQGDAAGGLFTGSVANSTWYHVFLIRKISNGNIDAGFDTDVAAGNIPTGWAAYRRLGSVLTDGSANIRAFLQFGTGLERASVWGNLGALDYDGSTSTTAALLTLSVPPGVSVEAELAAYLLSGTNDVIYLSPPGASDVAPSGTAWPLGHAREPGTAADLDAGIRVWTNTSSQIRWRASSNGSTLRIATLGWRESL